MEEDDDNSHHHNNNDSKSIPKIPRSVTATTGKKMPPPSGVRKKAISYSQPLGPHGPIGNLGVLRRKSSARNHSLDDDDFATAAAAILAVDDINSCDVDGMNNSNRFYHHSSSLPEEVLRRRQKLPLPPSHLGLDRITSSPLPAGSNEKIGAGLPEFMGSGGGEGIFAVPTRGAMHARRPPSLELRPHPLRETQVGSFLRTIVCAQSQLWAGMESGVRVWDLEEVSKDDGKALTGDEESAPFKESCRTSPALCLAVDDGNRLVWSGHKDGKIRSWKMDLPQLTPNSSHGDKTTTAPTTPTAAGINNNNNGSGRSSSASGTQITGRNSGFKEGLSWQAHRGPVLCMAFTSQGDLWSGSEGGFMRVWPWDSIGKSLSLSMGERHMAALLVERCCIDLRSRFTVNGVCSLPSADIRFLLSDHSRSKVWSGTSASFALWNSRTKELIKVFNTDGHVENKVDSSSEEKKLKVDTHAEDEKKAKVFSISRKDKSQLNFFQRSRNVLIGAADAVCRAASKGAFGEDNRKIEAMTISMDGMIWTGCSSGTLVQWDGNAERLQELQHHSSSVLSLCAFGTRLWVGYASGTIQMLDLEGNLLGGWEVHSNIPVINMAVDRGFLFTLANHGAIHGWHLTSPGPIDDILRSELISKELLYTKFENIKILAGTWNVGQERAAHNSLISWVGSAACEADIVIIGCQEVEMGAGFLAMAAAKETVGLEGSTNGHWWMDAIGKTLDEGKVFYRVGSRQLAGLLISVWARKNIKKHIGDIDAAAVACGFGRAIGNKGGVGLRMRIYGRSVCLVNCHLAAHLEAVTKRNADFDHIFRTMSFSRPSIGPHSSGAGTTSAVQVARGPNTPGVQSEDVTPELSEADMIIFLGDFNYRLDGISYDEARDFVSQRCFDWLREKDQLREEMKAGKVFQGMREGLIRFPPTYKFERHRAGLSGYDSGEKKRIPAWCDRILYRDTRSFTLQECSLECPVVSSILQYDACMDVTDSDHKPVRCLLNMDIARIDKTVRRQQFEEILASNENIRSSIKDICTVPEITVSTDNIILQNEEATIIHITNKCKKEKAVIETKCDGHSSSSVKENELIYEMQHPRGGYGFPRWLEVTPTVGVIKPGEVMEISVRDDESHVLEETVEAIIPPQNENPKNKEVTLMVTVTGNYTTENTIHRIHVRSFFSSKQPAIASNNSNCSYRKTQQSSNMLKSISKHTTSLDNNMRRSRRKP